MCESIARKYAVNPGNHLFDGDDQDWDGSAIERVRVRMALLSACVVGVETSPISKDGDPAFLGLTYPEGFATFIVVCRVMEGRSLDPFPLRTTRKHQVTPVWFTIFCVGTQAVIETLNAAQPHPDYEEEDRG